MAKIISIKSKLLSLRGHMEINDEQGTELFSARGEFSFLFSPTWRIFQNEKMVASIKKIRWSFFPKWQITSDIGSFLIKRKLFSFRREYSVVGGQYARAIAKGNLLDLAFTIENDNQVIARITEKLLSLRDIHHIEVLHDNDDSILFVTIMMVLMQIDKNDGKGNSVFADD